MQPRFIHLRLHTEYSLSNGMIQIQPLIDHALACQMPALGISDLSNLFAAVKFYQTATQAGIKPIIGCDLYLLNEKKPDQPFRLTAFCQNEIGYKNLLELISKSFLQGQTHLHPTITRAWLTEFSAGLIILSGAKEGDVGLALLANDQVQLHEHIQFWQTHFPERYYIELRRTGRPDEEHYLHLALDVSAKYQLPVVATNDALFLTADDFEAHEARVCIHQGFVLTDPRRPKYYSEQQYFRSEAEMCELFADIPEALTNSVEIAKRCNLTLTLGKNFLPVFPVPNEQTVEHYLCDAAKQGLEKRLSIIFKDSDHATVNIQRRPYDLRLQMELDVINKMGFAGYFLIVADFTRWARNNDVPVGPGRGSGPGSLVAYALKITDLNPLAYDLLFERFLNPERVSMPDFDIDFCMDGRDRVIEYVMKTHGRASVAQIITYGTMAARAVLRDVGRVLGMRYGQVDKIAKLIPFEIDMTLDKALEQEELLRQHYQQEEEIKTLFDLARKLEGITRNVGKHAGGVVIAPGKLTQFTALYCEAGEPEHIVTQFDKDDVESVGLVKFDFLGLRTLTIIHWAVRQINISRTEAPLDILLLPMNDAPTYSLLKACQTTAVFQLESRGMKDLVKRLQPDCFEDIIALVALFRPGPLQSGMVDDFINRKHGRARVVYPHPELEPILRPTYGVILYQEQVMQIAQVLAGYSLGAADLLRRAMGKKKPEEMAIQREIFCKGATARGVKQETATSIFDLMEKFAGYGFNKSHSASYALIAYQTAWLKTHYPAAFMAAVLSADMDNTDKVVHFIEDCRLLELDIQPPNINQSNYAFTMLGEKQISYGLGAIKGAGEAAIELIVEARTKNGLFTDLFDFCCRVDLRKVNRRVLEALIKAGAFDLIGPHRASLLASIDIALHHAEQTLRDAVRGQHDLFGASTNTRGAIDYIHKPPFHDYERLLHEKETLGLYLTGHPIQRYLSELEHFTTCRLTEAHPQANQLVTVAGIITQIRLIQTKRGDRMAVITMDDNSKQMDVLLFPENYHKFRDLLVKDKLIVVEGEIGLDDFSNQFRVLPREVLSIEQARERFAKHLQITVTTQQSALLKELTHVLEPFRGGKCHISIDYLRHDAAGLLQLGNDWCVRPVDGLLDCLRDIFSDEQVMMVY